MSVLLRSEQTEAESLTTFSASRLGLAARCGLAFEYKYVRKLPAPYDRAATLFGNVVHDGVHLWYGNDDKPNDHTKTDLVPLVLAQWETVLPPKIWQGVLHMRGLDEECDNLAGLILMKRPTLKSPRTTKEFLESPLAKEFADARLEILELCDKLPDVKWAKDKDPYKEYCKSAEIAAWHESRWKHLPRPMAVERPFNIQFEGFELRGRIDQIRADPDAHGEGEFPLVDIKTGVQMYSQMEGFLQMWIYYKARQTFEVPASNVIEFWWSRHKKVQQGRIDPKRMDRLASRILNGRARSIVMGQFEPSYGFWCPRCDFADVCSSEISIWEGDGIVATPMEAALAA